MIDSFPESTKLVAHLSELIRKGKEMIDLPRRFIVDDTVKLGAVSEPRFLDRGRECEVVFALGGGPLRALELFHRKPFGVCLPHPALHSAARILRFRAEIGRDLSPTRLRCGHVVDEEDQVDAVTVA